ncbi:MAG: thioredoxin [Candidatus Obscuribacter phosphatis]|uniref:Thioredoxin n=1 Tax=Candidatus Obscuribacter phosphatis TaxID=1906157 RepID=A0A8J7TN16_9BACT|nr:thioredoxin [Candidatus Obscuribacter phosphatis]
MMQVFSKAGLTAALTIATAILSLSACSHSPEKQAASSAEANIEAISIEKTNDETFKKDVLMSKEPVVVDFYADWCQPCKMMEPVVESLAGEYKGKVKFYKLNIDESPITTGLCGIGPIPTLAVFKNGELVGGNVGMAPRSHLKMVLEKFL